MQETKLNIMLHPVRMRIAQTLLGERKLTVQQISELLPEIPQATMYRHLSKLLKAGIISVVEENHIRGAVEKVYSLVEGGPQMTKEDIRNISKEDHFKYFFSFLINLLGDFEKYLSQETYDIVKDGVTYRQASAYLSDEEYMDFMKAINTIAMEAIKNKPDNNRRLRTIATIVIPDTEEEK